MPLVLPRTPPFPERPADLAAATAEHLERLRRALVDQATGALPVSGALVLTLLKRTDAAVAPGVGVLTLRVEPGTNPGTLKLVAYAGTSTTGVTVADNIGAGS